MAQKPVLRVEVGARALRVLILKNKGSTGRVSAGVQGNRKAANNQKILVCGRLALYLPLLHISCYDHGPQQKKLRSFFQWLLSLSHAPHHWRRSVAVNSF